MKPALKITATLRQASELIEHGLAARETLPALEKVASRYAVAITPDVAARLDRFAEQHRWTRSTAAAVLIEQGLPAEDDAR